MNKAKQDFSFTVKTSSGKTEQYAIQQGATKALVITNTPTNASTAWVSVEKARERYATVKRMMARNRKSSRVWIV